MTTKCGFLGTSRLTMVVLGFISALLLIACTTDAQRIEEANEAARISQQNTPSAIGSNPSSAASTSSTTLQRSGEVGIFDVRDGDCFDASFPGDAEEIESIDIVDCTGYWEERALNSFVVELSSEFPGDEFFTLLGIERCDRRYTYILHPVKESWELGDRTVSCIQERGGIEDTELLDRTVRVGGLRDGECFNEIAESQFLALELVNCLGEWDYRVTNDFEIATEGPFPGDDYIDDLASSRCAPEYGFIYAPTVDTWPNGDRLVTCLIVR